MHSYTEHVLYRFRGLADGYGPNGSLVMGPSGLLYGTTAQGGRHFSAGAVFDNAP